MLPVRLHGFVIHLLEIEADSGASIGYPPLFQQIPEA